MLEPNDILAERYNIVKKVGTGSTGLVYLANDTVLGRKVAVKVIRRKYAQQVQARKRFSREAQVAALLRHPGAVSIYDYGDEDGLLFLVMEFVEGKTLDAILKDDECSTENAVDYSKQIASVLAHAHDHRLVHRDIKPENIFIDDTSGKQSIRVVDFGLAFIAVEEESAIGRLTREGILAGTPAYMSPEQAQGKQIGPPSDVYSLGCVLYAMLTGKPPFTGILGNVLAKHVFSTPKKIGQECPDRGFATPLELLVSEMLYKSPGHRPSAADVESRLAELQKTGPDTQVLTPTQQSTSYRNYKRDFDGRALRVFAIGFEETAQVELESTLKSCGVSVHFGSASECSAAGTFLKKEPGNSGGSSETLDVILVDGGTPGRVQKLAAVAPVIVRIENDINSIVEMIRAGASDAYVGSISSNAVATKLFRSAQHKMSERVGAQK